MAMAQNPSHSRILHMCETELTGVRNEFAGAYGYGLEGQRVEQEVRGNRSEDEFRGEFRGNLRVDGRAHAVEGRMDYSGAFRSEIPRQPCASGNDLGKGVKSSAGAGLQGGQGSATATNTCREYGNGTDMDTDQAPLPGRMNALPYGPYQPRPEGREDETSRGGEGGENVHKAAELELEDANSAGGPVSNSEDPDAKRPARIVWTPQLHKRFVEAVGHLGIKNAVPKTIMQLMNVEGLTRENVASHLQKYRLHLKRMQAGHCTDGPSAPDHLFSSAPLPPGIMPPGMSPHFIPISSSREDGGAPAFTPPIIPMPFQGLVRPGPFGGYEHMPYGRGFMPRPPMPDPRIAIPDPSASQSYQNRQNLASLSSQPGVLPLFPTNHG